MIVREADIDIFSAYSDFAYRDFKTRELAGMLCKPYETETIESTVSERFLACAPTSTFLGSIGVIYGA